MLDWFTFHYVYIYMNWLKNTMIIVQKIYIPLCLYLYEQRFENCNLESEFTFHYVYIYIDSRKRNCPAYFIYIPLCLYLYVFPAGINISAIYLHSTMFIFILNLHRWCLMYHLQIYIPLCLYLYGILSITTFNASKFTFHYVYIYISQAVPMLIKVLIFTFHYVYIYIYKKSYGVTRGKKFTFHYVYIYI